MNTTRPSLLERAAEVYDFGTGLPAAPANDLPPPRVRPMAPVPRAPAAALAEVLPQPELHQGPENRPRPQVQKQRLAPVRHRKVELDLSALAATGYMVGGAPSGSLAEEMRLIKRRLLTAIDARADAGDDQARLVLVASGQPGEGKTFMAINLALSIATEPERSVLLIDGDAAKPELMARLGVAEDLPGFVDSLADPQLDPESMVLDTDVERLSLLPAGAKVRNIPELLASARTEQVLAQLRDADSRRIIILDSSPALAASTASVLAQMAGHTLVVVKADTTSDADLKETLDLLSVCDHLSLVLNGTALEVGGRRFGKYEEYR
jgi:Mrp family chromosome partitioning ATPase